MLVTTFSRQLLRSVLEEMLAMLWCDEIVDAFTRQCDIGRVRIQLAVLKEGPIDIPVNEVIVEFQHAFFGQLVHIEPDV